MAGAVEVAAAQRWPPSLAELAGRAVLAYSGAMLTAARALLPTDVGRSLRAAHTHVCFVCGQPFWREATVVVRAARFPAAAPAMYRLCRPTSDHIARVPPPDHV
jgi:hypothetical protein